MSFDTSHLKPTDFQILFQTLCTAEFLLFKNGKPEIDDDKKL